MATLPSLPCVYCTVLTVFRNALGNAECGKCTDAKYAESQKCAMEGCAEKHSALQAVCEYHYNCIRLLWQ